MFSRIFSASPRPESAASAVRRTTTFALAFVASAGSVIAEPVLLSEPAAVVRLTLREHPALAAAAREIERAAARLDGSGRLANPEVELSTWTDRPFGGDGERGWSLALSQRFPVAGRLRGERAVSAALLQQARNEWEQAFNEIAALAAERWFEAAESAERERHAEARAKLLEERIDELRAAAERGEVSVLDVNQARLDFDALHWHRRTLADDARKARFELAGAIGLSGAEPPVVAFRPGPTENPSGILNGPAPTDTPRERAALAATRTTDAALALARKERWDDIALTLKFEAERKESFPVGALREDQFIGLAVSVPLPLWQRNDARLRQRLAERGHAHEAVRAARLEAQNSDRKLRDEALALYERMNEAEERLVRPARAFLSDLQAAAERGEASAKALFEARMRLAEYEETHALTRLRFERTLHRWLAATARGPFAPPPLPEADATHFTDISNQP